MSHIQMIYIDVLYTKNVTCKFSIRDVFLKIQKYLSFMTMFNSAAIMLKIFKNYMGYLMFLMKPSLTFSMNCLQQIQFLKFFLRIHIGCQKI